MLKSEIQEAAGPLQASTGLKSGAEAAIHSMKDIFSSVDTDAVILVDASNAFNSLNRQVSLHNVQYTCPPFATVLISTYRNPSRLLISGGREILSQEGETQGDNLAMPFYGLATKTLLDTLSAKVGDVKQIWLADDATGAGNLAALRLWWDTIIHEGKKIGYHVNASKSWLIIKDPTKLEVKKEEFNGTDIKVTIDGKRHLGAAIGSEKFRSAYIKTKVNDWCDEINRLSTFATTQPHAAFSAFIHGEQHRFTYFLRTIEGIGDYLKPLDDIISNKLLPAIFGSSITEQERSLFQLPINGGGLGFKSFSEKAASDYGYSILLTAPLVVIMSTQGNFQPEPNEYKATHREIEHLKENKIKGCKKAAKAREFRYISTNQATRSLQLAECFTSIRTWV